MLAKITIVIPIEKQIMSALGNRFPVVHCISQMRDIEKNIWSDFSFNNLLFNASLLGRTKAAKFSYCSSVGRKRVLMGLLRVAL